MRYNDGPAIRMPSNNFVCPCKGFVPGLELQHDDEELHSSCFQKEEVILDLSFFAKVEVLLSASGDSTGAPMLRSKRMRCPETW